MSFALPFSRNRNGNSSRIYSLPPHPDPLPRWGRGKQKAVSVKFAARIVNRGSGIKFFSLAPIGGEGRGEGANSVQAENHQNFSGNLNSPCRTSISFLIPLHNNLELTRACLRTLQETVDLAPHEVILINDVSTDGTVNFLATLPEPFRVLHNSQRSGYAVSMNRGVEVARGEMLCLLNNDLVFRPGWLQPMLRAFEKFENVGIVGNVQVNPRTRKYDHMGVVFGPNGSPVHFGTDFTFRPFRGCTRWQAVTAACCLVKKSVFLAAGGFDEAYRNGCEDIDLCLKLGSQGYRHFVANASIIDHCVSASEGRHLFDLENNRRLLERCRERMNSIVTPRERRWFAGNYVLRCLCTPSCFRIGKMRRALLTLLTCGH